MRNTGTIYSSTERSPTVLPEMAELLPPLTGEQLSALEADLLKNGCYSPVIVNEDMVVIDGHNRQSLCEKHGLPYQMAVFSFEDLLEAKQWALDTQKGRRNLDKWELGKIALRLKPDIEARAKENMGTRTDLSATLPKGSEPVDTRKELADAESDRRHKIAGLFCKAFERAILLTPTEENVRIWTQCTRMTPEEIEDSVKEARELAEVFTTIAGILETLLTGDTGSVE